MPFYKHETNNDSNLFEAKVKIRLSAIQHLQNIVLLDCFHGEGLIWKEVQKRCPEKIFEITGIDKKVYAGTDSIIGNNITILKKLNIEKFNVIDLDHYGNPAKQLQIIFDKRWHGVICATFINIVAMNPERTIAKYNNMSVELIKASMGCTGKDQYSMFTNFLAANGVKNLKVAGNKKKKYMWFILVN